MMMLLLIMIKLCAAVTISFMPLESPLLPNFAGFYFQPIEPTPTTATTCTNQFCSCTSWGMTCPDQCPYEDGCSGNFDLDLTTSSEITFSWKASDDDTKWIEVSGSDRSRIEFQAIFDCPDGSPYQDIAGADITFEFEFVDNQGLPQQYVYDPAESFIDLGKCDGCGHCEVYSRMQFSPMASSTLNLYFKSFSWTASYDNTNVIAENNNYYWGTDKYCWVRNPDRRTERRMLTENVYLIHELADLVPGSGGNSASSKSIPIAFLLAFWAFWFTN